LIIFAKLDDKMMNSESRYTVIDLFAGAGGLSEGFRMNGFDVIAANDYDQEAANTFRFNHPETKFFEQPIQELSASELLNSLGMKPGDLDVLAGGPPCQAFSINNHNRGFHDDRSNLFKEYVRMVGGLQPKSFVMENVTGMSSLDQGRAIKEIYELLGDLGYHVEHQTLKAEEFGVPQERRRVIFIGTRKGTIQWPSPSHFGKSTSLMNFLPLRRPFVSVEEAINDLPVLSIEEGDEVTEYSRPATSDFQRFMRKGATKLYNHVAPNLGATNLERIRHIPPGGSWRDIPFDLLPDGMKKAKRSDHTKRYGRLHPLGLASTILTKCDLHWGAYIHPSQERTLTVREAARFQSFPDHIRFMGPRAEQFRQVGNAVPPLLGSAIAKSIEKLLDCSHREKETCLNVAKKSYC
jgi:DNA (cytosine-5)-methyltransferase 1